MGLVSSEKGEREEYNVTALLIVVNRLIEDISD